MEGQQVPEVILKTRKNGAWEDVNTKDFFAGKTVVLFSLPGAFTPTCSSTHLPRYEQIFPALQKEGVDIVACMSVNDGFVMDSWGKDQNCKNVVLLPDGNCEFTDAMGMTCDKQDAGFGKRSWRYSMLVKDGKIEKIFAEPVQNGDPFLVSDADTMFKYLNPKADIPPSVLLFTKEGCSFCKKAKELLTGKGLGYEEVVCGLNGSVSLAALRAVADAVTTPQVFMNGKLIGGYDDLAKFLA
mmetsp:Transcript_16239/g.19361  ORF Transcript_16239/g.19361 Transcript_16239/m.19361 type:complete len:241 (-) Transcript_16239:556-1278(-)